MRLLRQNFQRRSIHHATRWHRRRLAVNRRHDRRRAGAEHIHAGRRQRETDFAIGVGALADFAQRAAITHAARYQAEWQMGRRLAVDQEAPLGRVARAHVVRMRERHQLQAHAAGLQYRLRRRAVADEGLQTAVLVADDDIPGAGRYLLRIALLRRTETLVRAVDGIAAEDALRHHADFIRALL